ncbi:MAG: polysaccharide biosynthesis protein [Paludibacteraceae bacterium]|nr:polysaccharide biosynthesis protein [Paludibacteraceae bacterium]
MQSLLETDIFSHIPDMKYTPRWAVLLIDIVLCFAAYVISYAIGSSLFTYGIDGLVLSFWQQMISMMLIQVFCFWLFHSYSGIIRFSTFVDIIKVLLAVVSCGAIVLLTNIIVQYTADVKLFLNTLPLIYCPLAFVTLFCLRVGVKTLYDTVLQHTGQRRRVLIYGTKSAGLAIAKMLRSSGSYYEYVPKGFITDGKDIKSYSIQGLPIYVNNDDLIPMMQRHNIRDVIVSPIKMKEINPGVDLSKFLKNDIRILTAPSFSSWTQGDESQVRIGRIESIQIEDLLERPTITMNIENVSAILRGQVVMITGAAGSIGSELVRQALRFNPSVVVLFEQAESPLHDLQLDLRHQYPNANIVAYIGDLRDKVAMERAFADYHPDVIFHAGAYKHVPLMEEFPNEAVRANVLGTKNLADLAVSYGVKRFVMISTDKAVNPTNVMGASKRIAEIYVQSLYNKLSAENPSCTRFITTRFGNVLGSNGSVIPYFKKQIAQGGPVTVTHPDIIRFFMTIQEACTLVMEAATLGNGGEIFIFDMGHQVKILDLAKNMIRLAGYRPDVDIPIVFTGLRPGEKLYEEVLNRKEITLPTENEKIKIARVREENYDKVSIVIDRLIETAAKESPMQTVAQMKQIVPEYKSKNSIYEQLDR